MVDEVAAAQPSKVTYHLHKSANESTYHFLSLSPFCD